MNKYIVTHNIYGWQTEVSGASNEQAALVANYVWDDKNINIKDYTIQQLNKG